MKHTKKFVSLLLTLIMALSMSVAVFAAGETGTITVEKAVVGQTYTIYKLLDLESYDADEGNYSYKAADDWSGFFTGDGAGASYVTIENGYVTWKKNADAAAFAKAAKEYAADNNISNQGTKEAASTTVTFENLELGYYLLDSSLGTLCSLDTMNPDATIREKNAVPTNEKTVQEDSNSQYGGVNDAEIGQTVNFKSAVTLPKGSQNVTFHDTMSAGLTLINNSIKVYTDAGMTVPLDAANYTVTTTGLADGCTFEVSFAQTYLNGLTADSTTVYVGYSATVNAGAVAGGDGNPNTSKIEYGEEGKTKTTPDSTTRTYTWSFDVLKYGNNDVSKVLKDAKFVLLSSDKAKVAAIENGKLTGWADVPAAGADWPANTVQVTGADGKIEIKGLDADTYYLRETEAPKGYNKLNDDVEVEIKPDTAADGKTMTLEAVTAKVNNQSGSLLPTTGGMGTTIFYAIGLILVIVAAVLLIARRRRSAKR